MSRFFRLLSLLLALWAVAPLAHAAEHGGGGGGNPDGPNFVKMPVIAFSVIGADNKIQREVQIVINLEMAKGKLEPELDPFKRKLQDAYLIAMSDMWDARPANAPSVSGEDIKNTLYKTTTDVVGPDLVKSVLILGIGERSHVR